MRPARVLVLALSAVCVAGAGAAVIAGLASSSSQNEAISTALISDLEHRNAQSLVEGSPQLTGLGVPESTSTPGLLAVIMEDDSRLRVQRDRYLELGEFFTAFETDVSLDSVQITGDSATVTFTESTTLQRSPYETGEAAPEYAYSFPQEATLRLHAGTWSVDTLTHETAHTPADFPETVAPDVSPTS